MKRKAFITTALVGCFMICLAAILDVNGKWTGTIKSPDGSDIDLNYVFKVDGDKLTGIAKAQGIEIKIDSGKVNGTDFKFNITNPEGIILPHTGKYYADGDSISININYQDMKFHSTLKRADK
jgi:hypothetical protein